ncbi:MarR family transcriptional regulator [Clostridium sp. CS001]|uniref:MarR family winged helix-turn-helix transcriptional regulator n=1 Tax=Clostridium sp. CS001 TaxID=2880648 RepID=UPI001CF40642|nr:MarR family transcriptional regulator [Clostridium sp. CS001]MCB2291486.1 MarR family transcriptional regulator [Clostridium sp. CS001]
MSELNNGIIIFKSLKRIGHRIKHIMGQYLGETNLTGPQGMMMGILSHDGEMKVSDLSEKLGLSNSTVSGIIDRLEKQGLVERTRSIDDRRVVNVKVSSNAQKNCKTNFSKIEKTFEDAISKATDEDIELILKGLSALERLIDNHDKDDTH